MLEYGIPGLGRTGFRIDPQGALAQLSGIAELRQSLVMLLATRPGERALAPEFGCALDRLLFEPNDDTTAGMANRLVAEAVARHEPRVRIDRLDAGPDPGRPGYLRIVLDFTDRRNAESGQVEHAIPVGDDR